LQAPHDKIPSELPMAFSLGYLLQQANIGQSRSSVLNPLQWMLVILVFGVGICLLAHSPSWLVVLFAIMLGLVLSLFLGAYIYFARTNPDALRSEQFSLSKLAIEKGMVGDTLSGLQPAHLEAVLSTSIDTVAVNPTPSLPSAK
jgi:hypothetical protein